MGKLIAIIDLFRKGSAVADPALWKNRANLALALTAVILSGCTVARGFGYEINISETEAAQIATGIAVIVGLLSNYLTSDKIGLLPAKDVPPDSGASYGGSRATDVNWVETAERDFPRDTGGGS